MNNVFHGTTETKMKEVLRTGFEGNGRWIMFAGKEEEAIRYAKSYCHTIENNKLTINDKPVLLTLDLSDFKILSNDSYVSEYSGNWERLVKLFDDGKIDGVLSDAQAHYYVIFNIEKLNAQIKSNPASFKQLNF